MDWIFQVIFEDMANHEYSIWIVGDMSVVGHKWEHSDVLCVSALTEVVYIYLLVGLTNQVPVYNKI